MKSKKEEWEAEAWRAGEDLEEEVESEESEREESEDLEGLEVWTGVEEEKDLSLSLLLLVSTCRSDFDL